MEIRASLRKSTRSTPCAAGRLSCSAEESEDLTKRHAKASTTNRCAGEALHDKGSYKVQESGREQPCQVGGSKPRIFHSLSSFAPRAAVRERLIRDSTPAAPLAWLDNPTNTFTGLTRQYGLLAVPSVWTFRCTDGTLAFPVLPGRVQSRNDHQTRPLNAPPRRERKEGCNYLRVKLVARSFAY